MYITTYIPSLNGPFIMVASAEDGTQMDSYTEQLSSDYSFNPLFVDLANPNTGTLTGTFENIYRVTFAGRFPAAVLDNLHVTLNYDS